MRKIFEVVQDSKHALSLSFVMFGGRSQTRICGWCAAALHQTAFGWALKASNVVCLTFRYERGKAAVPFDRSQRLCDMYGTDGATGCHSDIQTNAIEQHHMETAQQISSGQL